MRKRDFLMWKIVGKPVFTGINKRKIARMQGCKGVCKRKDTKSRLQTTYALQSCNLAILNMEELYERQTNHDIGATVPGSLRIL